MMQTDAWGRKCIFTVSVIFSRVFVFLHRWRNHHVMAYRSLPIAVTSEGEDKYPIFSNYCPINDFDWYVSFCVIYLLIKERKSYFTSWFEKLDSIIVFEKVDQNLFAFMIQCMKNLLCKSFHFPYFSRFRKNLRAQNQTCSEL